jgi:1-acyl-sn-glycerol-3-phosphate acyltransferase
MAYGDGWWRFSRLYLAPLSIWATRARGYGLDRMPAGGCVLAVNHLHWIDIAIVGSLSPRNLSYVAKVEVGRFPAGIGKYLEVHGTILVRRGESDREAVRKMRDYADAGRVVSLFVEGTRQKSGRPGHAQPGAAMVAIQEHVPVIPAAVYGSQYWKLGNFAPCSLAFGEPLLLEGYPPGGRGYKEASLEIERRINVLFDWLADVHARGRPPGETPPV